MTDRPHALITGAASGIGRAAAARLRADGWRIGALDAHPPGRTDPGTQWHRVDLAEADALADIVDGLRRTETRIDALVHAAGLMRADDAGGDTAERLWALHVAAVQRLAEGLTPLMPERTGRIVVLSSRAADGRAGRALYAASKAALNGWVRSWAADLIARGITVNAIAPSSVDTPMLRDPARAGASVKSLPIGRLIEPAEIAGLIAFLLSPAAGAITGQTITVCGGASLAAALP